MMKYYVKVHKRPDGLHVVAMCDEDLIGYKFEEGKLSFEVTKYFYMGDLRDEEFVLKLFKVYINFNIVGNNILDLLLKKGLVDQDQIIQMGKVKHAIVLL